VKLIPDRWCHECDRAMFAPAVRLGRRSARGISGRRACRLCLAEALALLLGDAPEARVVRELLLGARPADPAREVALAALLGDPQAADIVRDVLAKGG
jgi:hypothetical protein